MSTEKNSDEVAPHLDLDLDRLKALLVSGDIATFYKYHPADIALIINRMDSDDCILLVSFFNNIGNEQASDIFSHLDDDKKELFVNYLDDKKIAQIIEYLDSDDAADLFELIDESRSEKIISRLKEGVGISKLLEYGNESAGGIMQTELFSVNKDITVGEAIEIYAKRDDLDNVHNLFLVDNENRLAGVLPITDLILHPKKMRVGDLVSEGKLVKAVTNMDQEKVAEIFKHYDLVSLPVVDEDDKLVGRILIDDVVDILEDEASEDILMMVGANEEALRSGLSSFEMLWHRVPWLIISLLASFVTGVVILIFENTIRDMIALAAFIPVVMSITGNVSVQSSTLLIRGVSTGSIDLKSLAYFIRELKVAVLLSITCGLTAALVSYIWQMNYGTSIIVGLSISVSILFASFAGTMFPLFLRYMNIDPAIAGGPMVLAISDISAVTIFFVTASILLSVFG